MMTRGFNDRLLMWTLALLAVLGVAVHLLHGTQVWRHAQTLLAQAEEAEGASEFDRAAARLSRYLQLAPDDAHELAHYAVLLDQTAATPAARWRALGVLRQALAGQPSRQDLRRRLVMRAMETSAYAEAGKHLEVLIRANPTDGGLATLLGRCLESRGEFDRAAVAYEDAIRHDPEGSEAYARLADLLLRQRQPEKADSVMDRLVTAKPKSAETYRARGRQRLAQGNLDQAKVDLATALELAPHDPAMLKENAILAQRRGDLKTARRFWTESLAAGPVDPNAYLALAALARDDGDWRAVESALDHGLVQFPHNADLLQVQAALHIERGHLERASEIIARLREDGSTRARAAYLDGLLRLHEQDYGRAIQVLEEVSRAPGTPSELASRASEALGHVYAELGDRDRQLAACERAVNWNPASLSARLGFAAALSATGRMDGALAQYRYLGAIPGAPRAALCRTLIRHNLLLPATSRDWREVESVLDQLAKSTPDEAQVAVLRAEALSGQGQPNAAWQVLDEQREKGPAPVAVTNALADLAAGRGNMDEASRLWKQALTGTKKDIATTRACAAFWERWGGSNAVPALAELEIIEGEFAHPDQLRLLRTLGQAHYRLGRAASAERLARVVAERDPADLACRLLLVDLALDAGRADAVASLLPALRRLEGEDGTWWRYGEAALACLRDDPAHRPEARRLLADLSRRRPGWSRLALLQARLDEWDGDAKRALDDLVRCIEFGDVRPALVFEITRRLAEWGRYAEADAAIVRLQQQANLGREFARFAADTALRAGNPERAVTLARQAASEETRDYRDHLWRSEILAAAGRRHEAEQACRRAVELAPHAQDAWLALIAFQGGNEDLEHALATLAKAERALPAEAALLTRAAYEESLRHWDKADACYRRALANRPQDISLLQRAVRFYLRIDQPRQAEPLLRGLLDSPLSVSQQALAWARCQLALVLMESKGGAALAEATALLDQERRPGKPESLAVQRARAFVHATRAEHRPHALRSLVDSLAPQTMTADEQFRLARLAEQENDWPVAREQMLHLLAKDKENPAYLAQYIEWLLERDKGDDAMLWMARLEKTAPDDLRTQSLRQRFAKALSAGTDARSAQP